MSDTVTIIKETIDSMKDSLLLTESKVGNFLIYKNDTIVSKAIDMYGEYCYAEVDIMKKYLPSEDCQYVDVGTNIGYHLVAIQKETNCNALGFEPNIKHFAVASYNSQNYPKIQILNVGASNATAEIPLQDFDPTQHDNYGTTHIHKDGKAMVKVIPLDSLALTRCDVIKIDVEGHELEVLEGSVKTIDNYRPVIFYEAIEYDVWTKCNEFLSDRKYKQYWVGCRTKPIAPTFKVNDQNPFGNGAVSNILSVPSENPQPDYLMEVVPGESFVVCIQRYVKLKLVY